MSFTLSYMWLIEACKPSRDRSHRRERGHVVSVSFCGHSRGYSKVEDPQVPVFTLKILVPWSHNAAWAG
jgi:hypothetical protein